MKKNKEITNQDLARTINSLSQTVNGIDKKISGLEKSVDSKISALGKNIDNLARITKQGFDYTNQKMDKMEQGIYVLGQGQEDIKLRLDNVAYRFELKNLEKRVRKLELKTGLVK